MSDNPISIRPLNIEYEKLDDAQKKAYDEIASGPRGIVEGPLRVWLLNPELAERAQLLGAYCRYNTKLPPRLSELAIIIVGAFWRAGFEWHIHAPIAQNAGISPDIIENIRTRQIPEFEKSDEKAIYDFMYALLYQGEVPDEIYNRAITEIGLNAAVDLVGIAGYYCLICLTINAFKVPVPPPAIEPFK